MSPPAGFSEQWRREERAERDRLRQLEGRLDDLRGRRHKLLNEVRSLSSQQQELYNQREGPYAEAEHLHQEFLRYAHQLVELRASCDQARHGLEEAVIRRRELVLTFPPGERMNPDQVRREIAALELRQQTRALPIEEENALIAELRKKARELEQFERHKELVEQHELQRREADTAIVAAKGEVDRIVKEMAVARTERDRRKAEIPAKLEAAGAAVAEMRVAGRSRAELVAQVDALGREIAEVEREGRTVLARFRQRQEDAREILQEYARPLPSASVSDPTLPATPAPEPGEKRVKNDSPE